MKIKKQTILLIILGFIAVVSYIIFPQFDREDFNTDTIEEISSGMIKQVLLQQLYKVKLKMKMRLITMKKYLKKVNMILY